MNLDQIKQHPYYPFANFRDDDLSFLLLELYWAELFGSVVHGTAQAAGWSALAPADREDGNPVLYLIDRRSVPARSLRIVQRFNTQQLPALDLQGSAALEFTGDAYVPFVPDLGRGALDDDGSTPIEELVIASDVSDACEALNRHWLALWCLERAAPAAVQRELDAYWAAVNARLVEVNAVSPLHAQPPAPS